MNELLICFVFCVFSCVAGVLSVCNSEVVATASSQVPGLALLSSAENLEPRNPSMKNSASFFLFLFSLYLTLVLVVFFFGVSWLIWCAILIAERKQGEEEQDVESEKMFMLCFERRR